MNRMRWSGGVGLAAVVLAGVLGTACAESTAQPPNTANGNPEGAQPAGTEASEDMSPEAQELRSLHRNTHGGFVRYALLSIPSLGVSKEQEAAVEQVRADIHAKLRPAHEADAALLNILADGVAAGAIDMPKVDAATAKIGEVATQMDDATNDDLNRLHGILNPAERAALVDKVEAHFLIWQKANAEHENHANQEQEGGHIYHLAQVLALSPEQVQKIDAAFTSSMAAFTAAHGKWDPKAAEDHFRAFAAAFAADQFDAKTLTTADKANQSVTSWGSMRMVRMYEAMTPVLTPDQRTKLAALLREHATKLMTK